MKVSLVSKTKIEEQYIKEVIEPEFPELVPIIRENIEALLIYCARVSSNNQGNPEYSKLLKYCINKKHWSVFAMADLTYEIYTSRAIAPQIRTHTSFQFDSQEDEFQFQEFSQRYQIAPETYEPFLGYKQSSTNRQGAKEPLDVETRRIWLKMQEDNFNRSYEVYKTALSMGVAKDGARAVLPLQITTRLFMKGSIRSWIHYLEARTTPETQIEHKEVADAIKSNLISTLPYVSKSCGWVLEE